MVGKILIVEDNPLALQMLKAILTADGHDVSTVISGEEALECTPKARVDLILLDIALPGIDGFEVCRTLKADPATATIPVIFISVKDKTEEKLKGFAVGGTDYISKPFAAQEVLVRVRTQLKLAAAHRQLLEKNEELRQEVAARKEAEEHFRILYQQCPDGIAVVDPRTLEFVTFNTVTHVRLGYTVEEFARVDLAQLVESHSRGELLQVVDRVLREGAVEFEAKGRRKSGELRDILVSARKLVIAGRPLVHCVMHDATERNKMQEELIKTQRLESLGFLAGGIAHDFNNLLTAIMGNISLAKMQLDEEVPPYKLLSKTELACLRARELTRQLLTFAKGGEPVKRLTAIVELVRESASFVLSGTNVGCDFEISEGLWPCEVDPGQIGQVMQNLVLNAQQAMPQGGKITVSCKNVPGSDGDDQVEIAVQDSGMGIAKEVKERIFDPFFSTKRSGSGLGLATSYSIVRKHKGRIDVESTPCGSTFTVRLPATRQQARTVAEQATPPQLRPLNILTMDDDEMVQEVLFEMLKGLGHQVQCCSDGTEAVREYRDSVVHGRVFDCVIVDLTVPGGMGGKEALRELKRIDPRVKVLASSGYASDSSLSDWTNFGFSGALAKPYSIKALQEALEGLFSAAA